MITVVENEPAIRKYQRQFSRSLKLLADEEIPVELGHPGASIRTKVSWSDSLGIWFFSRKIADRRYWNAFGMRRPEGGAHIPITCEINFPLCGIDRRTGGAFAEEGAGQVFVIHRGKLGGGKKGVGKGLFESRYRGAWEIMNDGGDETPVAVIGVLNSPRLARQIAQFVHKIARIKETATARSAQAEFTFNESSIREELIGDRYPGQVRETGSECDHGLIVRDLSEALKGHGLRTENDGSRDLLAISPGGRIRAVFQVLTGISLAEIHPGAAKLLLNGLNLPEEPLLFLTLPRAPEETLREKLKRLNIDLLIYNWQGDRVVFPGLGA
ncbi:MAG: hypothetical protein ABIJ57_11685, partial [Pseudomonadota bacterium]